MAGNTTDTTPQFVDERDGQLHFFKNFISGFDEIRDAILVDSTDGVYNGTMFEFKLSIGNLSAVLFQAVKYASHRRVKGEPVPKNILLVDLRDEKAYLYHAQDYFDEIHAIYFGPASKNNKKFVAGKPAEEIDYSTAKGAIRIKSLLKETGYMPIAIDENCIVAWARRYYSEVKGADKGDFLGDDSGKMKVKGEIREPKHFKGQILPYKNSTNERFKYLMDMLNERVRQSDLGAFYTPEPYCCLAGHLLQQAIERVPEGNDYVVIDRCAGTGNLEAILDDEVLSHCILATYEYYEYKVLQERLGDKVRAIIPPIEDQVEYSSGYVLNADALSKGFVENEVIKDYIDDPNTTIILYENPPYAEGASVEHQKKGRGKDSSAWKSSFVLQEMAKDIRRHNDAYKGNTKRRIGDRATNDKANAFIWSAFEYYLRQPTDSYVLFSPAKYWKYQHLVNKKFLGGYLFNKRWFHATPSAIICILWSNEEDLSNECLTLQAYDISDEGTSLKLVDMGMAVDVMRTYSVLSAFYDKRKDPNDEPGIACSYNGREKTGKTRIKPIRNDNIIGYLVAQTATFENPRLLCNLFTIPIYNGNGFYLRKDNWREKLPLFAAAKYPVERKWWENGTIYKSFDGGSAFTKDQEFLDDCLIFTCLSYFNKCRSFTGSDGREYRNELCFDEGTLASEALEDIDLSDDEKKLIKVWNLVLAEAKKTKGYDASRTYGVFQISDELNTFHKVANGKKEVSVPDYPQLNGYLSSLRDLLSEYYDKYIVPKCFTYQLLK